MQAAFAELEKAQRPFILTHALDHWPASRWSIAAVQRKFGSTKLNFTVQGLELEMPVGTRPSSQVHPRRTVASGHELRSCAAHAPWTPGSLLLTVLY